MKSDLVRSRTDLMEYLGQSARAGYLEYENGRLRQVSTFLKSYIVERHLDSDGTEHDWPKVFVLQEQLPDGITRLVTRRGRVFFAERLSHRFCMVHTIERTNETDSIIGSVTSGINSLSDRAWMPSSFLLENRRGQLAGYKLVSDPIRVEPIQAEPAEVESQAPLSVESGESGDEPAEEGEPTGFRLSSNSRDYAYSDLAQILNTSIFMNRRSIDWLKMEHELNEQNTIESTVYSNGKIISKAPSAESHVDEVRRIAEVYGNAIQELENNYSVRWAMTQSGPIRLGEPLILELNDYRISNLEWFIEAVFSGLSEFRLFGTPTKLSNRRFDVEAVDLHRGDTISFEITDSWIRVYLPEDSCSNTVFRFFWNFQRHFSSNLTLGAASGEIIFSEGRI